MTSLILRTATDALVSMLLLFSILLLLRGHNLPGGGFAGGLVASASVWTYAVAQGVEEARATLQVEPRTLSALGLGVALLAAVVPMAFGRPLLTGLWIETVAPVLGKVALGTPLLFDVGVYLLVLGATLTMLFAMEEGAA